MWIAVLLLIFAVSFCVYEEVYIKNECKNIVATTSNILNDKDLDSKKIKCQKLINKGFELIKKASLVCEKSNINDAKVSFNELKTLLKSESDIDALDEIILEIKNEFDMIYKSSNIEISNIF